MQVKKNILENKNLWKFENTFLYEMIRANPHNEELKNKLYNWFIEGWNI